MKTAQKETTLKLRVYKFCERCKKEMSPGDEVRKVGRRYYHLHCNRPASEPNVETAQRKRRLQDAKPVTKMETLAGPVRELLEARQEVGEDLADTARRLADHWDKVPRVDPDKEQARLKALSLDPDFHANCSLEDFGKLFCPGAAPASLARCWRRMRQTGLNPQTGHIYFKRLSAGEWDPIVTIHGMRLVANRLGRVNGEGPPEWCGTDGRWVPAWSEPGPPTAARFTLFLKDQDHPVFGIANFKELCPKFREGTLWKTPEHWERRPAGQISKCAEAAAYRKAHPAELGDTYAPEEWEFREAQAARPTLVLGVDPAGPGTDESSLTVAQREGKGYRLEQAADLVRAAEASWPAQGTGWGIDQAGQVVPPEPLDTPQGRIFSGKLVNLFQNPQARNQFLESEGVTDRTRPSASQITGLLPFLDFISIGRLRGLRDEEIDSLATLWGLTSPRWRLPNAQIQSRCSDLQTLSDSDLVSALQRAGIR